MALLPMLPDRAWAETRRLGRDHWVRGASCDYSVHPCAIRSSFASISRAGGDLRRRRGRPPPPVVGQEP